MSMMRRRIRLKKTKAGSYPESGGLFDDRLTFWQLLLKNCEVYAKIRDAAMILNCFVLRKYAKEGETMIELSKERIEKILYEETAKNEALATILRSIYTRYMLLYERYFADIDALNDERIAEFRNYREETISLIKYYYLDIPQDICEDLNEFENEYNDKLLGSDWHKYLFDRYEEFKKKSESRNKSEEYLKAEFSKQTLSDFYEAMDYIFRESLGTNEKTTGDVLNGVAGLLFGK